MTFLGLQAPQGAPAQAGTLFMLRLPAAALLFVLEPVVSELVSPSGTPVMFYRPERSNVRASTQISEVRLKAHDSQNPSCLRAVSTETSSVSIKIQEEKQ